MVGACSVGVVIVVALVVGAVAVVVGLDVDRGYGLGVVVVGYTYADKVFFKKKAIYDFAYISAYPKL